MRNEKMAGLDGLVGNYAVTLSDAWFLEPAGTEVKGTAAFAWLGEGLLAMRLDLDGEMTVVFGRSDARDEYSALYHDERGVCRVFAATFDGTTLEMRREDPDFFQTLTLVVAGPDRIDGRTDMSEDRGATWRKDFDLTFDRV
ncbi:hypothetical protein [Phytomonospora endophytica]|uniref:DUF1579 domain-containing protein n=1 Tax=Phytomonospora endophytica TaxID=714109 RepID=A0A841FHB8_9ACTN|nr:hypothetical protein [Phytomonospora endophytica]MBB6036721.1 hypothetical protein [Phytomonospora endophytica]GIG68245.1 hypothetical protein Pen01_45400 [Phytomonospora endophytica]